MSPVALADWWPVARGAGARMRLGNRLEAPSTLPAHVGLWLDRPTVGCAKSLLTGKFQEPAPEAGSVSPLTDRGEQIGAAVRTKNKIQPVYVSAGHQIDLASAVRVVLQTCRGYRIPEPTRLAHNRVNEVRRGEAG